MDRIWSTVLLLSRAALLERLVLRRCHSLWVSLHLGQLRLSSWWSPFLISTFWRCRTFPSIFSRWRLLFLDSLPKDPVTQWLSTTAEDREWVQPLVSAKDLLPVLICANVELAAIVVSLHLKVLDCCLVG